MLQSSSPSNTEANRGMGSGLVKGQRTHSADSGFQFHHLASCTRQPCTLFCHKLANNNLVKKSFFGRKYIFQIKPINRSDYKILFSLHVSGSHRCAECLRQGLHGEEITFSRDCSPSARLWAVPGDAFIIHPKVTASWFCKCFGSPGDPSAFLPSTITSLSFTPF